MVLIILVFVSGVACTYQQKQDCYPDEKIKVKRVRLLLNFQRNEERPAQHENPEEKKEIFRFVAVQVEKKFLGTAPFVDCHGFISNIVSLFR
jgi:hypothetical protein